MITPVRQLMCNPGKVGVMATDASANDPVFWPLHLLYDRSWQAGRLAGTLVDDWTTTATTTTAAMDAVVDDGVAAEADVEECYGSRASDVMPFTSFLSGDADSTTLLTNEELYAFFDPTNEDLPYVYDTFDFL
jgi:hypothetical protein